MGTVEVLEILAVGYRMRGSEIVDLTSEGG